MSFVGWRYGWACHTVHGFTRAVRKLDITSRAQLTDALRDDAPSPPSPRG